MRRYGSVGDPPGRRCYVMCIKIFQIYETTFSRIVFFFPKPSSFDTCNMEESTLENQVLSHIIFLPTFFFINKKNLIFLYIFKLSFSGYSLSMYYRNSFLINLPTIITN